MPRGATCFLQTASIDAPMDAQAQIPSHRHERERWFIRPAAGNQVQHSYNIREGWKGSGLFGDVHSHSTFTFAVAAQIITYSTPQTRRIVRGPLVETQRFLLSGGGISGMATARRVGCGLHEAGERKRPCSGVRERNGAQVIGGLVRGES